MLIERAQQLHFGLGHFRFLVFDIDYVIMVHANNELEIVKMFLDQLLRRMFELYTVFAQHGHRPMVRRAAHVPIAKAGTFGVPLVGHAFLSGHLFEHGLGHRRPAYVAQAHEHDSTLVVVGHRGGRFRKKTRIRQKHAERMGLKHFLRGICIHCNFVGSRRGQIENATNR